MTPVKYAITTDQLSPCTHNKFIKDPSHKEWRERD